MNNLTKGTTLLTFSSLFFIISSYVISVYLGKFLGPQKYGVYGVIISLITAINLTQTSGLPQAVSKFIAENENKAESILKSGLILQLVSTFVLTIVYLLLAKSIALLLKDPSLVFLLELSSFVFPLYGIYALYSSYYNGLHLFKIQAFMQTIYSLAKLISVIALVYFFYVNGAIFGFVIAPLIALLFKFHYPQKVDYHFSYKKLILFSLPLIGVAIFSNLLQSVDLFFVKAILHSDQNTGFYTANQNIAEIPYYGIASLSSVLFPSISRHVSQKLTNETKNLINKSLRFSLMIITPSILLISATSLQALDLLYSSAYNQGAEALAILAIGNGFFTLFVILITIISGSGSPIKSSVLAGIGVLISTFLCMFLIPLFGINGAALSTTLAAFTVMICAAIIVYWKFKVLLNISSILKIMIASLLVYIIAKNIILPVLFLPLIYIILFAIYFGLLLLLKEIKKDDIVLAMLFITNKGDS